MRVYKIWFHKIVKKPYNGPKGKLLNKTYEYKYLLCYLFKISHNFNGPKFLRLPDLMPHKP